MRWEVRAVARMERRIIGRRWRDCFVVRRWAARAVAVVTGGRRGKRKRVSLWGRSE